jgi:glycosyltransferase involved in cell wall biosynthesis
MQSVSVIIAFYNNIEFLEWILAGFSRQDFTDFEIVLADDGSTQDTTDQIPQIQGKFGLKVRHIWHEDEGWRKNIILNKAIASCQSEYLIFIDGDCIPHKSFVKEHYNNRLKNTFLAGRRVHLSPRINAQLSIQKIKEGYLENPWVYFMDSFKHRPRAKNAEKSIYLKSRWLRDWVNRKPKGLLGCNMSMYRKDLLALNGFDERYLHPGIGEDDDLTLRAGNAGIQIKTVQNLAIQYHIWHKKSNPSGHEENLKILIENKNANLGATPYSILDENEN